METQSDFGQFSRFASSSLYEISQYIFDFIIKESNSGNFSNEEFEQQLLKYYFPIKKIADEINRKEQVDLAEKMTKDFEKIQIKTEKLKNTIKKIQKTQDVINSCVLLLGFAAALASFVAAPTPVTFSAVSFSLINLENSLKATNQ